MKYEELFPTNITPEEKATGFLLVESIIPHLNYETSSGIPFTTVVAVLYLEPEKNVRLIKTRNPMPELGESAVDYNLEIFGIDALVEIKPWMEPRWNSDGGGLALGLDQTIARYRREGVSSDWQLRPAPEERIVSPNE